MISNLTPHPVVIHRTDGSVVTLPPSGQVARVAVSLAQAGEADRVPLVRGTYGQVIDLPDQQEGVLLVVSALVRAALPDRRDLASPADLVRDTVGRVLGCRALEVS